MKNKNIKPQKCGRWLFLHFRFSKIFRGRIPGPPYKGNTSIKPSKSFFSNNSSQSKKNRAGKPSPIKTIYRKFIFRLYRNWKKEEGAGARSFFVWSVIGLFETLICAIAEDKVCDSCIVSSWALLIFSLCDDQIQIFCAVWFRKMENLAVTFCYLWLTEKLWLLGPPEPPFKTLITLLPVTFSQLDPQLGVGWGKRFLLW